MNYFVSCLYGDFQKYMEIKDSLRGNDTLWILGDVLDGNDEEPEACLDILNDIIGSPNVTLVLGDHEYARCQEYNSSWDVKISQSWREYTGTFEVSAEAFNRLTDSFSPEDRDFYFGSFLTGACELSAVIPIGGIYAYATHGCPATYAHSILPEWQLRTCTSNPDFQKDLWKSIRTDEFSIPYQKGGKPPMCRENTITIVGQMSAAKACRVAGIPDNGDGYFYANRTLAIGRTYPDEPVTVVGVDAAGFFVKGIY